MDKRCPFLHDFLLLLGTGDCTRHLTYPVSRVEGFMGGETTRALVHQSSLLGVNELGCRKPSSPSSDCIPLTSMKGLPRLSTAF